LSYVGAIRRSPRRARRERLRPDLDIVNPTSTAAAVGGDDDAPDHGAPNDPSRRPPRADSLRILPRHAWPTGSRISHGVALEPVVSPAAFR